MEFTITVHYNSGLMTPINIYYIIGNTIEELHFSFYGSGIWWSGKVLANKFTIYNLPINISIRNIKRKFYRKFYYRDSYVLF